MTDNTSLEEQIKATVLRPLADKFMEIHDDAIKPDFQRPATIEDAVATTEGYVHIAYQRLQALIQHSIDTAVREARIDELKALGQMHGRDTFITIANGDVQEVEERIAQLTKERQG